MVNYRRLERVIYAHFPHEELDLADKFLFNKIIFNGFSIYQIQEIALIDTDLVNQILKGIEQFGYKAKGCH